MYNSKKRAIRRSPLQVCVSRSRFRGTTAYNSQLKYIMASHTQGRRLLTGAEPFFPTANHRLIRLSSRVANLDPTLWNTCTTSTSTIMAMYSTAYL